MEAAYFTTILSKLSFFLTSAHVLDEFYMMMQEELQLVILFLSLLRILFVYYYFLSLFN